MSQVSAERLAVVRQFAGLDAPDNGSFERIARMAATVFATPMATVSIVDEDRVWFLATQGLDGVTQVGTEAGLCASAILGSEPYVVNDAAADPRTQAHPLVAGEPAIRFYAAAPIVIGGHALGTVNVLDRKRHRRVSATQISLLGDLAATVAEMMQIRLSALAVLRTERAGRDEQDRQRAETSIQAERVQDESSSTNDARPKWCQLGGTIACSNPAEMKMADSWGDSAWACWQHAEDALMNVPPVFVASDSPYGLAAYRARTSRQPLS